MSDQERPRTAFQMIHARCGPPGADEVIATLRGDLDAMRRGRSSADQHLRAAIDERDKLLERIDRMSEELRIASSVNAVMRSELAAAQSEIQAGIEKRAKPARKR